jgi:hypothetical protein
MANYKLEGDDRYGLQDGYEYSFEKREWVRSKVEVDEIRQKIDEAIRNEELRKREEEIKRRLEKDFRDYRLQVKDEGKKDEGQKMVMWDRPIRYINVDVTKQRQVYFKDGIGYYVYADTGDRYNGGVYNVEVSPVAYVANSAPGSGPSIMAKALANFTYPQMRELACELVDMFKAKEENGQKLDLLDWHIWAEFFNAWQEGEHKLAEIRAKAEEKKEEKD